MHFRFLAVFGLTIACASWTLGVTATTPAPTPCYVLLQNVTTSINSSKTITNADKVQLMNNFMKFNLAAAKTTITKLHNTKKIGNPLFQLIQTLLTKLTPNAATTTAIKAMWNNCTASDIQTVQTNLNPLNLGALMTILSSKVAVLKPAQQTLIQTYLGKVMGTC